MLDILLQRLEDLRGQGDSSAIIVHIEYILSLISAEELPLRWSSLQRELGDVLQEVAQEQDQIQQALHCYDQALTIYTYQDTPDHWAMTLHHKGLALRKLSTFVVEKQESGILQQALSCYNQALTVYTYQTTPSEWANVLYHRGFALHRLAVFQSGKEQEDTFREILRGYDGLLRVYTSASHPNEWATAQNNKGIALYWLAQSLNGPEQLAYLHLAVVCHEQAMTVYTFEQAPNDWAMMQQSKADALRELVGHAPAEEQAALIQRALTAYDNALLIYDHTESPEDWALIHYHKGGLHFELAERQAGRPRIDSLQATAESYEQALLVYQREDFPLDWAIMQNNRGIAFHQLAEQLSGEERAKALRNAHFCYDQALIVRRRELFPLDWAATLSNKSYILHDLAVMTTGKAQIELLQSALDHLDQALLEARREVAPDHWASIQHNKGNILRHLAALQDGKRAVTTLRASIACYDAALQECTREKAPSDWARMNNSKGGTIFELAKVMLGEQHATLLHDALTCYDQALLEYRRDVAPTQWALLQNNRGVILHQLADLLTAQERLQYLSLSLASYNRALAVYTREETPSDWARTQGNKGIILQELAKALTGKEQKDMIKAAIACQDAAMLVYTRERAPNDRAMAQSSKGNALVILAELQTGGEQKETLGKAWQCFDDALAIYASDTNPINWALTSLNKGNAFYRVARSLTFPEREELLRAALGSYDAALTVQLKGVDPASWALVHNSKGGTLTSLAESPLLSNTEQTTILYDAVSCYEAALSIYRRKDKPTDWAMIQNNKGVALRLIAEKSEGEPQLPLLRRAECCHNAVLTTITRETAPLLWAATQNNQCVTYLDMANVLSRSQREKKLQLAQNCADAALSIYKRELFPAEHLRTAQYIGMHLFTRGYWPQAIQYLSSAFEALDNLFNLEITIRGRQSTLTSGTAIPACLAFALLQSEESERVIQAARILERSRARISGEAILHQEVQLAIVEQQMPDLLNEFRTASQRLAMISLPKEDSLATPFIEHNEPSLPHLAEEPDKPIQSREQASRTLFNAHLAEYEEAQEAHQAYDKIVTQINEHLPTFLQTSSGFDQALQEITPDERLVYVADTPLGAIALLAGNSDEHHQTPETQYWVDPSLTSPVTEQLLTGKNEELDTRGLLEAQHNSSILVRELKAVSERLGQDEGIFANLASYCRTHAIQQLVVIPCGLLSLFPLHLSLINNHGQKELLLDRILISYAPSAYIWSVCRRRAKEPTKLANILLVSDPQPQHAQLRSLPGAREEAQAVTHIVEQATHGQVHILAEENATRQQVLAWLNHGEADFSYAHFACHGIVEFVDPYTSGVTLAHSERLTTRDLLDPSVVEPMRLRLAVLSACQTGLPGTQLPDEVVGLASGWLQVGAVGVIASLWPVSDRQTARLMKMFYMLHLIDHIPPIRALWLAQRWLRGLPTWRQDFVSAGALHAAQEPDPEEALFNKHEWDFAISKQPGKGGVVHEENGEMALEKVRETIKLTTMISADFELLMTTEEFRFWDNVRHWAAFVFYGA